MPTTPGIEPRQLSILLTAARTFAARHPGTSPELTYEYWTAAARLRTFGRRALARADHDPVLPEGGEAFMTAVVRHTLTPQETDTPSNPTPGTSLADTSDEALTALITALASYLDHRTTTRLHRERGLRTWSVAQQADADRHHAEATRLLATLRERWDETEK